MAKLFGYARVSTTDQDLKIQRKALKRAGCGIIFEEKVSGTKRDGREELTKVLGVLGKGDALVVTRLDRLGRSLRDLPRRRKWRRKTPKVFGAFSCALHKC